MSRKHPTRRTCCALAVAASLVGCVGGSAAWGQLRIVSMNTTNFDPLRTGPQPGMELILQALASTVSDDPNMAGNTGIVRRPDVFAIQEALSWQTTGVEYQQLLAQLFPGSNYVVAQFNGASNGAGTQILIYNADALQLMGTKGVGQTSGSGISRQPTRFQMRPVGYTSAADFYIYNFHTKAGPEDVNVQRRGVEGVASRADADALPENSNIIYLGDFNTYRASEPFYTAMIAPGRAQAIDPIDMDGTPSNPAQWTNNSAWKSVHTQSPFSQATADALGTGFSGATGGMDDRLDFQLVTANVLDGQGFAYIPNSYQAFGNNNTHQYNQPIDYKVGGVMVNKAQPPAVLTAMASIMDHVPVVADYQLPAKMTVVATPTNVAGKIIRGTAASVDLAVTNSAPVQYAIGADELVYALSTSGTAGGSRGGTKAALAAASHHTVTLATDTAGVKAGSWSVVSTSQQVAGGTAGQAYNYTVVDHSNASFFTAADGNARGIDFGYVPVGFANRTGGFSIANLQAASGFTAGLALTDVATSGSAAITTNVTQFSNLAAGQQSSYVATLNTATAGVMSTTQTYAVADEAIPGATAQTPLVLTASARVIATATFPVTGFMQLNSGEVYDTGAFSIAAGVTLTKSGLGTMNVSGMQSNGAGAKLSVTGGSVRMASDAGGLAVSVSNSTLALDASQHISSLTMSGGSAVSLKAGIGATLVTGSLTMTGGTLDLADGDMMIDYAGDSPAGDVVEWLAGENIRTSAGDAITGIGWAEAGVLGLSSFNGEALDGAALLLKYTYFGDTDLDGRVTADDLGRADRGFAMGLGGWVNGDFNYDGSVDGADFLLMDRAYGAQAGVLSSGFLADREAVFGKEYVTELVASVPEPGAAAALLAVVGGLRRRRRVSQESECDGR